MVSPSDEQLDYIGPAPIYGALEDEVTEGQVKDERDLGTLELIKKRLRAKMAGYQNIASLTIDESTATVKEQLAINKQVVYELQDILNVINNSIKEVKERQNGN